MTSEALTDPDHYRHSCVDLSLLEWSEDLELELGEPLDRTRLNRSIVEEIVGPFPELMAYWEAEMEGPTVRVPGLGGTEREVIRDQSYYGSWGYIVWRMYHPKYLRDVVRHHLWTTKGQGDVLPSPETLDRIERAVADDEELGLDRLRTLTDPFRRAISAWALSNCFDAEYWEDLAARRRALKEPYSSLAIKMDSLMRTLDSGLGEVEIRNSEGEVVLRVEQHNQSGPSAASSN